jgi:hypothetical protein
MRLPHEYKGFVVTARKAPRTGMWWLDITLEGTVVRSYKPPLQVIYLNDGRVAYDDDVRHCQKLIDRIIKKLNP